MKQFLTIAFQKHKSVFKSKKLATYLIFFVSVLYQSSIVASTQSRPELEIFSKEIVQNIKQTSEVAGAMEQSLKDIISRLEKQEELFQAAHCDTDGKDMGCEQLRSQLADSYLEMLDLMEERLPKIEQSLKSTHKSLQKRIYKQMGKNRTAAGLQDLVKKSANPSHSPTLGKRALSKRVSKYYALVRNGSQGSLSVVAAELYLDSNEVIELISLIREEIGRSRLMVEIGQTWGIVSPEMQSTVQGVKSTIFGEEITQSGQISKLTASNQSSNYQSPLELR